MMEPAKHSKENKLEKGIRVRNQLMEIGVHVFVTCGCGRTRPLLYSYRCYFCGEWYCERCAPKHFGISRIEYNSVCLVEMLKKMKGLV